MIRLHRVHEPHSYNPMTRKYQVSTKRKPRGYIASVSFTETIRQETCFLATVHHRVVQGWRPIGLNGYVGNFYATNRQAINALVSHKEFL